MEIVADHRDEDLLEATGRDGEPRTRVVRSTETAVIIGRGGDPECELELDAIRADRVPLRRRRGGGCAVVLDPGNLIVSVVLPLPGIAGVTLAFERISDWLIEGVAAVGVAGVTRQGISDLVLDDRKIGGSCIYRRRDLLYYSCTLLLAPRLELLGRYLKHPPREPAYRRGRSHVAFVRGLAERLAPAVMATFPERLTAALGSQPLRVAQVGPEAAILPASAAVRLSA